jgi:hypothetical protein
MGCSSSKNHKRPYPEPDDRDEYRRYPDAHEHELDEDARCLHVFYEQVEQYRCRIISNLINCVPKELAKLAFGYTTLVETDSEIDRKFSSRYEFIQTRLSQTRSLPDGTSLASYENYSEGIVLFDMQTVVINGVVHHLKFDRWGWQRSIYKITSLILHVNRNCSILKRRKE